MDRISFEGSDMRCRCRGYGVHGVLYPRSVAREGGFEGWWDVLIVTFVPSKGGVRV